MVEPARLAVLVREILRGYPLPARGTHGIGHWARVLENGLRLAPLTGADAEVVTLFAVFHDSRRVNEEQDDGHGLRGAELARSLQGPLFRLDAGRLDLLLEACRLHTAGRREGDVTVRTCWDADRLDLGRVGIVPEPRRLCTGAAGALLGWAHRRAVTEVEPEIASAWLEGCAAPPGAA